jgi:hypothetical protein
MIFVTARKYSIKNCGVENPEILFNTLKLEEVDIFLVNN